MIFLCGNSFDFTSSDGIIYQIYTKIRHVKLGKSEIEVQFLGQNTLLHTESCTNSVMLPEYRDLMNREQFSGNGLMTQKNRHSRKKPLINPIFEPFFIV